MFFMFFIRKSMFLTSVVRTMWTQSTSVTDGQTDRRTDGRTDRITITKTVQRIVSHGKNVQYLMLNNMLKFEYF